jgi:rubredoxin
VTVRLWPPIHEAAAALRFIGLRDRLRCPNCRAVGTWKPHGYRHARRTGDRPVRRWLCKYCGHYQGPEGTVTCVVDPELGVWRFPHDMDPTAPDDLTTPREILRDHKVWPWAG